MVQRIVLPHVVHTHRETLDVNLSSKFHSSKFPGLKAAFSLLDRRDVRKLGVVTTLQIFSAGLDLLGVGAIGLLGALAVNGVASQSTSPRISNLMEFLNLNHLEFQSQIAILGVISALLLISKTLFAVFFTRFYLYFLSRRSAQITTSLVKKMLQRPVTTLRNVSSQEILFGLSAGVNAITMGIIASCILIVSDLALLLVMAVALLLVDIAIAVSTFILFGCIALLLYWLMQHRARRLGSLDAQLAVANNNSILEILGSFREIVARNRQSFYGENTEKVQNSITRTRAELTFLPNVSKYVVETSVVLGALSIAAIQFAIHDASHAVATMAVFMAAGTRIAPAVLRIQQGAIALRSNLGVANITLDLVKTLNGSEVLESNNSPNVNKGQFIPEIEIRNVSYKYPGATQNALTDINLKISAGMQVAIVGGSGAGKSTLVDLILGLLIPTAGTVEISGNTPTVATHAWQGEISYLPQTPFISDSTIRENITLGYPPEHYSEPEVLSAMRQAQLEDVVMSLPLGLDSRVGESGAMLSGGQRQRIGLARALISKPRLLILDEVTSALDAETESQVTEAISTLSPETTVIVIAHQLRTIRKSDLVIFLEKGEVAASGNFDELERNSSNFKKIVELNRL